MKYLFAILVAVSLVGCGPSYRLEQEFTSRCVGHGGLDKVDSKGYHVYIAHCKDGTGIKGVDRR